MGSNSKRQTTAAKRDRERALVERRHQKQVRKAARKQEAAAQNGTPRASSPEPANAAPVEAASEAFADMRESDRQNRTAG